MKLLSNLNQWNAKTKWAIALCTVLAMSAASVSADDTKDKSQGGPGADSKSAIGTAGQPGQQASQLAKADEKFVHEAARGGMMEVHMGKMGVQQAQNSQLKQFAQKLIDDHTKANSELQQFAAKKGITLPRESEGISSTTAPGSDYAAKEPTTSTTTSTDPSTSPESKGAPGQDRGLTSSGGSDNEMKKLHGLTGSDFDREYIRMAVKHHQKDVREFEQASKKVEDQELRSWIDKTLPTLREHLQTAQSLQTTVGGAGAPGTDAGTSSGNSSSGTGTSSGTPSDQLNKPSDQLNK